MVSKISLNRQQQRAVRHKAGPLLIVAGAGTGKTTVITERVKYLIGKEAVSPDEILAVTFTDKAAAEIATRLDVVMPFGYEEPWLGTFHAVCDRILKAEGLEIGLDPGYKIITPVDQWILIKQHLFDFTFKYYRPLGNPTKFIAALIRFISRVADEDISPREFSSFVDVKKKIVKNDEEVEKNEKLQELIAAIEKYEQIKPSESVLDFGDLITKTLVLFRQRKMVLKKYKEKFKHVLVDEFQDTNYAQLLHHSLLSFS